MGAEDLQTRVQDRDLDPTLSVYGYTDFRAYLKDYYAFRKDGRRGYSYRSFSKAAGFSSPNFLKLVIEGQRNVGPEALENFVRALRFKPQMADYFRALVRMNQAKTDEEKQHWFEELRRLIPNAKRRLLEAEGLKYLSHWLYPVIREMVSLPEFRDDPYWIARRINGPATIPEISSALQFLKKEGYIQRRDDGTWEQQDNMVISSDEVKSLAIRNYHRQMVDLAKETLDILPVEEREFGALTFILPEEALDELKFRLKSFRQELHSWAVQAAQDTRKDTVVQLNFQMFPHTKRGSA